MTILGLCEKKVRLLRNDIITNFLCLWMRSSFCWKHSRLGQWFYHYIVYWTFISIRPIIDLMVFRDVKQSKVPFTDKLHWFFLWGIISNEMVVRMWFLIFSTYLGLKFGIDKKRPSTRMRTLSWVPFFRVTSSEEGWNWIPDKGQIHRMESKYKGWALVIFANFFSM